MENGGQLMSTCCVLQNYVHSFYGRTAISSLLSIYLCTYTVDGCHVATSVNYHDHPLALHMLSTATIVPLHCLRIGRSVGGQSASQQMDYSSSPGTPFIIVVYSRFLRSSISFLQLSFHALTLPRRNVSHRGLCPPLHCRMLRQALYTVSTPTSGSLV